MRLVVTGLAAITFVAGCATHPNNISGAYVSSARFMDLDCATLEREHRQADFMVRELTTRQEYKANRDAVMAGTALFLWPALLFVGSAGNDAAALSQAMGERDALASARRQKDCGAKPVETPAAQPASVS